MYPKLLQRISGFLIGPVTAASSAGFWQTWPLGHSAVPHKPCGTLSNGFSSRDEIHAWQRPACAVRNYSPGKRNRLTMLPAKNQYYSTKYLKGAFPP